MNAGTDDRIRNLAQDRDAESQHENAAASDGLQTYSTRRLFGEASEICLEHEGTRYLLKITRQGKLILNK